MATQFDYVYSDIVEGFQSLSGGYKSNRDRLVDAKTNLDYYKTCFEPYRTTLLRENPDLLQLPWRTTMLMKQIVDRLTEHLYRQDPARVITDNQPATDWLQKVYADNRCHAKWEYADKLTMISEACAFQIAGSADPHKPIKINLWDASQFVVYTDPDDSTEAKIVVTIDDWFDGEGMRKRYQVWEEDRYRVLVSERYGMVTKSVTVITDEENPYGTLPFAFAHYQYPVLGFWTGSPGNSLRDANGYINYRLTDLSMDIGQLKPLGVAENVAPEWSPRGKYRVGQFLLLPSENDSAGNPVGDPRLTYVEPSLNYVTGTWEDLHHYINQVLESSGVPEAAVRMSQGSARSGISVIAEQAPLIQFALSRQSLFYEFESDLAYKVCQVGVAHLRRNGVVVPALEVALKNWQFTVRWGKTYPPVLPGPEQDQNDQWLLEQGLKSKLMIVQERLAYTREEAILHLHQVAEDYDEFADIIPDEVVQPPARTQLAEESDPGMEPEGTAPTAADQKKVRKANDGSKRQTPIPTDTQAAVD